MLAADGHVHSEWSWDAPDGSMELTCARAGDLGLPAVAFTEHVDYATRAATASDLEERLQGLITPDGTLSPPELDLSGYLECVQRCRDRFPELRIFAGVELGETTLAQRYRRKAARRRTVRPRAGLPALPVAGPAVVRNA